MPEENIIGTLFQRRSTRSKGGNGFMSASDGLILSCTSFHVAPPSDDTKFGTSPRPSSFDAVPSTPETRLESMLDPLELLGRGIIVPLRRAAARRYVTLRSRRNVSRKKTTKTTRSTPRNAASSQKLARQPNTCVSVPPRMGPSEGPSKGAT
jgi:hypothetical protein